MDTHNIHMAVPIVGEVNYPGAACTNTLSDPPVPARNYLTPHVSWLILYLNLFSAS